MTLSWSQPGRAAPTSNDSNPEDEAEAEAEGLLVEGQRLIVLNAQKGEVIITPWNATDKYIELTTELGAAHATNSYSNGYNAEKAFKIIEEGYGVYWCTSSYPDLPVFLWFQFNNPKTVFKVKFVVDRYHLPTESVYEVFASNLINDCGNPSGQTILCSGTADEFGDGKKCANKQSYHCYGLKVSDHSTHYKQYIGVRKLQFLFGAQLPANSLAKYKGIFDSYDKDGDGEITFEEMGTVMRNKPDAKVQAEFNKLNTDGIGTIDFQDFLTRMMASWLKDVKTYFRALDQDGNGYVSEDELYEDLHHNPGPNKTEKEVDEMFHEADIDEDGELNFEEFVPLALSGKMKGK